MTKEVRDQIMAIRDTGATNMLDTKAVQRLAYEMDFFDLVLFIEENKKGYWDFIITGRKPEEAE